MVDAVISSNLTNLNEESKNWLENAFSVLETVKFVNKKMKQKLIEFDEISNSLVGFAFVENFALKIFNTAEQEDLFGVVTRLRRLIKERLLSNSLLLPCFLNF